MYHMPEGAHMMGHPGVAGYLAAAGLGASSVAAGRGVLARLLRSPIVLLTAGFAAGYLVHRYRKEIMLAVAKATDAGKDLWLQQKESLADLLAETKEAEEQATKQEAGER